MSGCPYCERDRCVCESPPLTSPGLYSAEVERTVIRRPGVRVEVEVERGAELGDVRDAVRAALDLALRTRTA